MHWTVIFTIRSDIGFAGYQKKSRPGTGYFTQYSKYEYNSNISHKIIRHYHWFPKIRWYSTHSARTAERNGRGGGGMVESRTRNSSKGVQRIGLRKFWKLEPWTCAFLRFGYQILVAALVNLQELVILWSRKAVRNCICGEKWEGAWPFCQPPAPRSLSRTIVHIYTANK